MIKEWLKDKLRREIIDEHYQALRNNKYVQVWESDTGIERIFTFFVNDTTKEGKKLYNKLNRLNE